jgi:hypothetical protein
MRLGLIDDDDLVWRVRLCEQHPNRVAENLATP